MRVKGLYIAIVILVLFCEGVSQDCPGLDHEEAAAKFLLDHKSNSRAADRHCVDQAFATLTLAARFKNKSYISFLVALLDFERWTPKEFVEAGEPKYPAIHELNFLHTEGINVVPYLIRGIKESGSEVLRANATEALYRSVSACGALKALQEEAEKTSVSFEQKERLEAAVQHVNDSRHSDVPCDTTSSKP